MKINLDRRPAIESVIDTAEKGCSVRKLGVDAIYMAVDRAERRLTRLGIPKKYWTGCSVDMLPESVCNSYQGPAYGTGCMVERFPSGWFVTFVGRIKCGTTAYGASGRDRLHLSPGAAAARPTTYDI